MSWDKKIPFDGVTGDMMNYPFHTRKCVWVDCHVFKATLKFRHGIRGRSAVRFVWEDDESGITYPMFMTDMVELLKNTTIRNGEITGTWTFCKRGSNFGILRVFK